MTDFWIFLMAVMMATLLVGVLIWDVMNGDDE